MEPMVEKEEVNSVADDTQLEAEPQDESESLESLTEVAEAKPAEDQEETQSQGTSEPGWIRKRVDKAVQKAVAETESRMRAEFDKQMAPIRERMITDEAKELVRSGEFKSLDRAKEYLQLKQGITPTPVTQQPRNEQGQFTSKVDPTIQARADVLAAQADKIKARSGVDVMEAFSNNQEIHDKIVTGEWDFYDVLDSMKEAKPKKSPAPMRSPNGASGSEKSSIASMTDAQFEKLQANLKEGKRYSI